MDKILLMTVHYPYGSAEQFPANEIEFLSKKGVDIIIYPSKRKGRARNLPDGVKIAKFKKSTPWYILGLNIVQVFRKYFSIFVQDFFSTVRDENIRIITYSRLLYIAGYWIRSFKFLLWYEDCDIDKRCLYYTYWMNSEAYAVSILKRYNEQLVSISRAHGGDLYIERNSGFLPFREVILKSLSGVYTISEHGKKYLLSSYSHVLNNKIHVSRLGVSSSSRVVPSNDDIIISSCSSDASVKRVLLILQSIGEFSKQNHVKVTWLHIGINKIDFERRYGSYLTKYPNLKCKILGFIPNTEVVDVYQKYSPSLFINASESEGVPVSIMEALSCGLPIIATNVGGISEIVDDHVGVLVDKDFSFDDIGNAINKLIGNREKYSKMAFKKWKDICNKEKNFLEFYSQLKEY
jgi:colanic acid/amylovoran biosynthesis glycosyltransferase